MRPMILAAALASAAVAGLALPLSQALAGPAESVAKERIAKVASGDVDAVMLAYGPDARLTWIGGALDGTYDTSKARDVWSKYSGAQGTQKADIASIQEVTNAKGSTVVADVTFTGKNKVRVYYVMAFRGDKLVDEIWQVTPPASPPAGK